MTSFPLPDLGEGLTEAEIVEWHVAEGDHVVADQPLLAVETEKAVVEVPSPRSGRILRLLAKPGDRVPVGTPLVEFDEGPHPDAGTVVGNLAAPSEPAGAHQEPALQKAPRPTVKATPAVRAFAASMSIDLTRIEGTGPDGAITRDDVARAAKESGAGTAGEPLRRVRLSMARNMARSHQAVAAATVFDDADVEPWYSATADVTLRLIRAIAAGCRAEPGLNCWFDDTRMMREIKSQIDLGIAVDTEAGLIVPVLRNIGQAGAAEIRKSLDQLKSAVQARSVAPAALKGATLTLSNFGTIRGRYAALVIVPPQVAIVGAGRIAPHAVPGPQGAVFHSVLPLSLTFDHRVVTGGEAARFLDAMIRDLERPN